MTTTTATTTTATTTTTTPVVTTAVECEPFRFKHQSCVQISGPSNCGKSEWLYKALKFRREIIDLPPQVIIYCYSVWQQELFDRMQTVCNNCIHFVEGLQTLQRIKFEPTVRHVLVLDDLMNEVGGSEFAANLFTRMAHHGNILIFFVTQNIYLKSKHMPTVNKNVKYNVVFRNKRFRHEL